MKLELDIQSTQNQDSANHNGFEANPSEDVKKLLRAGINAAKEGNRAEARSTLLQVTEAEPKNETAWLWLASISEYPEELLVFLQNVLKVNPDNERAIEWAKQTKALLSKTFVQRGIDASHQNQKDFAKQCFLQAIVHDEQNEMAWLWLASSTEVAEEKCSHLQKVLNINPENETAASSMKSVKTQLAQPFLKKASSAAIEGDHETARRNLEDVLKYSPELEEAWVLKAYLTQDFYEKIACYERALEINPEHDGAKAGLASLQSLAPKVAKSKGVIEEQQVTAEETVEENEPVLSEDLLETVQKESSEVENVGTDSGEMFTEVFDAPTGDLDESTALNASDVFLGKVSQNAEVVEEAVNAQGAQVVENSYEEVISQEPQMGDRAETVQEQVSQQTVQPEPNQEVEVSEATSIETESQTAESVESAENYQQFQLAVAEQTEDLSAPVAAEETVSFNEPVETAVTQDLQTENQIVEELIEEQQVVAGESQSESSEHLESKELAEDSNEPEVVQELETSQEVELSQKLEVSQEEPTPEVEASQEESNAEETISYQAETHHNNGFHAEAYVDHQQPTVEFSYQTAPVYAEQSAEPAAQEAVRPQPNYAVAEEAKVELKALEEVQTEATPVAEPAAESTICPFCETENDHQAVTCQSCKAMLSLSDLEMLLSHQNADQEVLLKAIERMEVEKTIKEFSVAELTNLGVAHLNAHNLRKGFNYLQEASQLNPNDVVLSSKVNFLAIRLSEIEEYDQKAQDHPVQSRTILVVDDSPTVRKLISGKLEKCGHSVVSAVDGMDALAKINEVIPDLILLDITMPRLDGYQVCKLIRNNELTKDIPVVMISGKDGFFDKVRGRMAGSTGYITKPFGPDTLMKTIETYLA